jgi:hypothetical protein
MKYLLHHYIFFAYLALNALCASPILFGGNWLLGRLDESHSFKMLLFIIGGTLVAVMLGLLGVSWTMAAFYAGNDIPFFKCFKLGWMGVWVSLSSLPVVKHWFGHGDETVPRPDDMNDSERE